MYLILRDEGLRHFRFFRLFRGWMISGVCRLVEQ